MPNAYEVAASGPARPGNQRRARRYSRFAPQLLEFFAFHRTALASHVQRAFPGLFSLDRTTRLHLQTLVAHGDLTTIRESGVGRPNVYSITTRGLRRAAESGSTVVVPGKRRPPAGSHLHHELLITELATSIHAAARIRADIRIRWQERCGFNRYPAFCDVVPDYAFLLHHTSGRLVCLVEVSSGEESATKLAAKLHTYAAWADSPEAAQFLMRAYQAAGAQQPRPTFRLLVVVHNRRTGIDATRLRQVFAGVLELPAAMQQRVWATTVSELGRATGIAARIWWSGAELTKVAADYQGLSRHRRTPYLTRALAVAPRHTLFPAPEPTP